MSSRSVLEVHNIGIGRTLEAEGPPRWDAAYLSQDAPKWQPPLHRCVTCGSQFHKPDMAMNGTECRWCYKPEPLKSLTLPRQLRKLTEGEAATRMSLRWTWEGNHTVTCTCDACA